MLLTAEGLGTSAIMRQTPKPKTCVWRWRNASPLKASRGFCTTRRGHRASPSSTSPSPSASSASFAAPPGETRHWTGAAMARAAGVSIGLVQRIWRAHGLQPHRVRQFKLSNDPEFVDKLRGVVGLDLHLPAYAVVLSVDEKSQIQALDRTQPGLPMKRGRAWNYDP